MRSLRLVLALSCLLTLASAGPAFSEEGNPSADVRIAATVTPQWQTVGYPLEYRITVGNDGPDAADGSVLRFAIPWQTRMISHDAPGSCSGSAPVVCALGSLPAGETLTVTVRVRATTHGQGPFEAQINTETADPATANNLVRVTASFSNPEYGVWQTPNGGPTPRWAAAGASNPAGRDAVLFGGEINDEGALSAETWRWDGASWSAVAAAVAPPARAATSVAWTGGTGGHLVLFGGESDSGFLGDTWTWDGSAWTPAAVSSSPSPRVGHAMAARDGTAVLFGGAGATGLLRDTWEWDGSSWTKKTPAVSPPARAGHVLIEDRAAGTVVLFGGCCDGDALLGDTWIWDGITWKKAASSASPPARADAAGTFDPATGTATLAGGWDDDFQTLADVWSWKDRRWVRRGAGPAREGAVLLHAADDGPGRLMLAGGAGSDGSLASGVAETVYPPGARVVAVTTGPIAFGAVLVGATVSRSIVLRNLGTQDATLSNTTVSGPAPAGVWTEYTACSSIPAGDTCTIPVHYTPGPQTYAAAPRSGTINVNLPDETLPYPFGGSRILVNASTHALASAVSVNTSFPVSWSAPGATGVVYDVEYSERVYRNYAWREAEWKRWRTGTISTSAWFGGAGQPPSGQGKTMLFRVRARRGTEVSSWSPVRSTLVPIDDRNWTMKFSSGWSSVNSSGRYFGTLRQTSSAGKRFSFVFETNRLRILGDRCSVCGAFDVYIDRVKVARVDSYARSALARQVLFDKYFSNGIKRHQLEIVTAGTRGRPWVKIDGVAAAR